MEQRLQLKLLVVLGDDSAQVLGVVLLVNINLGGVPDEEYTDMTASILI